MLLLNSVRLLVGVFTLSSLQAQSVSLPTDRGRVVVASIPDAYQPTGPALKVLRTDSNSPLRAGTAWIWEKQRQEEPESYYVKMRANGLNAVRMILFDTWEVEAYAPSATFTPTNWNDSAYRTRQLARMERAVNYASRNGMYVIINSHNKIPNYNAAYVDALWTYVAPYFANRTHVLYEAANEPFSGIGNNGSMTPNASDSAANSPRIQALKTTYNLIRAAAPATHIMILTPSGINDYATGTGLGNLAAAFASMPGAVDWTKTSVAYHLYNNDSAYGAATNAANLRNLHSRFPGWPSENAFPPGDFTGAVGLDEWRSIPFDNDLWVNQTCEKLGLGWAMWFINGDSQFDTNWPIMMADASAKNWTWVHDPLTQAPAASPAAGNFVGTAAVTLSSATPGTSIRFTLDGTDPTPSVGTLYTTPILLSATTTIKALAYGSGLPVSSTSTFTYTRVFPVSSVRVNAGGPALGSFAADSGFTTTSVQGAGTAVSVSGVANAAPAALYDTERWSTDAFTYTSPFLTPGRAYTVRLHFAERYVGTVGARRFHVSLNGATSGGQFLQNFDVYAAAGNSMNKAVVRTFSGVSPNSDGRIAVTFSVGSSQLPMVNGLEILAEPTALELFRTTHGLAADGSLDLAKPAGDGVPNLLKFAFNLIGPASGQGVSLLSPVSTLLTPNGNFGLPVSARQGSGALRVTFLRRKASSYPGISYALEFSDSLNAGSWVENRNATVVVESVDAVFERVSVTDHLTSSPKRFSRVRVTAQ